VQFLAMGDDGWRKEIYYLQAHGIAFIAFIAFIALSGAGSLDRSIFNDIHDHEPFVFE